MTDLRGLFLLDPEVTFLNHGSFGACPRPVFEVYQDWQRRLEWQPVHFIAGELLDHLKAAREKLAAYVGTTAEEVVFIPNATFGVNVIARSLQLAPGDEILADDHEYGACLNAWDFICQKTGASLVQQAIPLPVTSTDELVERFWKGVTPRTRLIFLSHLASPTALRFPVEEICTRAREAGILTLIDGAHAPGQLPLNIPDIGADFYTGNCHKWMMAPKGAAFLYVPFKNQSLVEPLIISWGWGENSLYTTGSVFIDGLEWWGTKDPSASLSVPAAIQFMVDHDWSAVQERCHQLAAATLRRLTGLTGLPPLYPDSSNLFAQFCAARLPEVPVEVLKKRLYEDYRIEIPVYRWQEEPVIRVSIQGYNTIEDTDKLVAALQVLLPELTTG